MSKATASIELLVRKLDDETETQRLAGMIFDFCLDQRLDRYLAPERVLALLDRHGIEYDPDGLWD